jgi:outer membrane lipoprotein-sorting protein
MRDTHKKIAVALICLTVFLPVASAGAYVLKSGHILQLMAGSSGKTKYLRINQHIVVFDHLADNGKIILPETVYYSFPTKFRSDIIAESIQRIHIVSNQVALTVIDRHITSETGSLFDSYKDLLLFRSRYLLEQRLNDMGIDTGISSFGRFNDTLAFVIGAQYPDESVSQVWVDKETFRPLRWIIKTGEPLIREFEIRYLQWQETGGGWYPWRVEFYENQMLVRQIAVDRVSPEKTIAREVFDVVALKKKYARQVDLLDPVDGEDISEVQKTIDSFKKRFE